MIQHATALLLVVFSYRECCSPYSFQHWSQQINSITTWRMLQNKIQLIIYGSTDDGLQFTHFGNIPTGFWKEPTRENRIPTVRSYAYREPKNKMRPRRLVKIKRNSRKWSKRSTQCLIKWPRWPKGPLIMPSNRIPYNDHLSLLHLLARLSLQR